jgi:hypothetical protein
LTEVQHKSSRLDLILINLPVVDLTDKPPLLSSIFDHAMVQASFDFIQFQYNVLPLLAKNNQKKMI